MNGLLLSGITVVSPEQAVAASTRRITAAVSRQTGVDRLLST
ncbi:hypothetical protein [Saccharothrix sp. ALI-22-I]|nr:hypothetical protein [Saccharothrix sp. ALI-22-I]